MKKTAILTALSALFALYSVIALADSMVDGDYFSPAGENGRGSCRLAINSLGEEPKYGDQLFQLESTGEGACEWSAIGLSKNFAITAGSVTSGGVQTFIKVTFPFGPAGKRIEVTSYDADGVVRNKELFLQSDMTSFTAE